MEKVGFIGTGNMGGALVRAASKAFDPARIYIANRTTEKSEMLASQTGCCVSTPEEIAKTCDFVFLGVKPQGMEALLSSLAPVFRERKEGFTLVSMAAGLEIATLQAMAGGEYPVIRMMPNTPVAVGEGVILYDCARNVTEKAETFFVELFRCAGLRDKLPEQLMDAGTSVAGCGPAFAALFVEGLAKGAEALGLPPEKAALYATQMLWGTGKLIAQSGKSPEQIRREVCSPGGSTIEGVKAFQQAGLIEIAVQAVEKAYRRNKELGKK